ncbi:MAG TPA: bacterial transcriptional activator domain-containing protein [Gemmatimonadales bacterium]|nr:bacterial transcriptional activator domain-containing protein [Gemmatimonadales bacterium]
MSYTLRTFGGLALAGGLAGDGVGAARRKPLALLVLLAGAGELGMTRDKLASYLWPEGETEKVRGVLKQTLYTIRQDFGEELIVGSQDLHLNRTEVDVDLWTFEKAVGDGRPQDAVETYRGPFLDGFHLADAPGFERWVEAQRVRLARRFAAQIELLALAAMGRNQPMVAVDWWLRLTEQDPLDVRAISGLLHACLAAGDRPNAIRYAERHMTLLRRELEITPDPEIRRLVEQARARPIPPAG